jgi:hypothetical protein
VLAPLLLVAALQGPTSATSPAPRPAPEYDGSARQTSVRTPRLDGRPVIDGRLDDAQWASAAVLRGFSQHNPLDGRPAEDSTRVYVWYGDDAMYFGIRAYAAPGAVHGTLADRDKIGNDDNVQVILDTFNDNRRAFVFGVNPLGVQADGVRSEGSFGRFAANVGGSSTATGGPGSSRLAISNVDLTQDMVWESKGRITEFGYEVEMRIPFKAVRYNPGRDTWGMNVVRTTVQSNFQDSWAPVMRASATTLPQNGRLTGLHDMTRGLVLDATPVVTSTTTGAPAPIPGSSQTQWRYTSAQALGGDVRWGLRPNMTLNGTIRPDFSQVEADAGQLPGDVRFALLFPELRPFFVEGAENFDTPNQLVYTRNIVRPDGAAKLIGKVGSTDVAILSALDGKQYAKGGGGDPAFNIARIRRDLGSQSTIGMLLADREDGNRFNRVGNLDVRYVFGGLYYAQLQYAGSLTDTSAGARYGRMWEGVVDRTGREFGFHYSMKGFSPDFVTQTGFVSRTNIVDVSANNRFTWFGARGARLESMTSFLTLQSIWTYGDFWRGQTPLEAKASMSTTAAIRGGWSFGLTPVLYTAGFDSSAYARYYRVHRSGTRADTVKFTPGGRTGTMMLQGKITAPQFARWGASISATYGQDAEFLETAQAQRLDVNASLDLRPTPQVRATVSMLHQEFVRNRDGRTILTTNIPRLRLEYQATRYLQFRFVGQYDSRMTDALRDAQTDDPILFRSGSRYTASTRAASNNLRADWLVAILPSPGRVLYVGYGATLTQPDAFSFQSTTKRTTDGLFVKLSYQFRVQ